ncbi:NAD dependent epimerase/dehydratase family protein-like protein [Xylaria bambusicola]|uniref:NAD dependent epimerase/dehydratase family protein-like protein n=1 Tax=Xylaria bambusicola TaxID=326684 RepID=UPI002007D82A|nr:NAD dependent epimerase/dehydratase family protein-like protein [Xylaria bambusicola]KAI0525434.1 NAD dependent epimerase/dehydratase family protein-like protein [Xylaria bambusicola]
MADPSNQPRILLTGASGFIGGSVLTQLLNSTSPSIQSAPITCLMRGADRAAKLIATYGDRVIPVLYSDLDDLETTTAVAAQHDVVISTTVGYHTPSTRAIQEGLAQRKRTHPGSEPWFIHTSGTSNVGSRSVSSASPEGGTFDDVADDVYGFEVAQNTKEPYAQRTTELAVVDAGLELDVRTLVVMAPTIYGVGSGLFRKHSIQIPAFVATALDHGRAVVISDGRAEWDHVHVQDLAALYEILALKALDAGDALPWGKKGIIFASVGRHSWGEIAQGVARACHDLGVLPDLPVDNLSLADGTRLFAKSYLGEADELLVELGLASSGRTIPTVARGLGWKPLRGKEDWERGFRDDVEAVLEERREKGH